MVRLVDEYQPSLSIAGSNVYQHLTGLVSRVLSGARGVEVCCGHWVLPRVVLGVQGRFSSIFYLFYFEKIRVFKAGRMAIEYISMG